MAEENRSPGITLTRFNIADTQKLGFLGWNGTDAEFNNFLSGLLNWISSADRRIQQLEEKTWTSTLPESKSSL
jgi:hypothetical protein